MENGKAAKETKEINLKQFLLVQVHKISFINLPDMLKNNITLAKKNRAGYNDNVRQREVRVSGECNNR